MRKFSIEEKESTTEKIGREERAARHREADKNAYRSNQRRITDLVNDNKLFKYMSDKGTLVPPAEGEKVQVHLQNGEVHIAHQLRDSQTGKRTWYLQGGGELGYTKVIAWLPIPLFRGPKSQFYKSTTEKGAHSGHSNDTKPKCSGRSIIICRTVNSK